MKAEVLTHSASEQFRFLEEFRSLYKAYATWVIPLGILSKARLVEISSHVYSNLITDRYSPDDLENYVEIAIALSECDFSNHHIFDALEYCLWSGDIITDLQYTRLFFSMSSCQYAPGEYGSNPYQHDGFKFHEYLGDII